MSRFSSQPVYNDGGSSNKVKNPVKNYGSGALGGIMAGLGSISSNKNNG